MESIDNVFDYVMPYIHDRNDRSSISLVFPKWYELDSITRKHLTVHSHYSLPPSRVHQRFPFIQSLTIKGFPYNVVEFPQKSGIDISITLWIKEIAVKFNCLKALHIRGMDVYDSSLELLARTRGKDLKVLKICKCRPFHEDGLMHVGKHFNQLRTLCLESNCTDFMEHGKWLHKLALCNTSIETFHFRYYYMCRPDEYVVKGLALLIKSCSKSLVSLEVNPGYLKDALSHGVKLENLVGDALSHAVKILRKLAYINGFGTHVGLIAVAQGCSNLEYLHVNLNNVSNEALECIGTNLKNLRDFYIRAVKEEEEEEEE
ncbi:hypothetical protein Tco_0996664 [Tanacetum coccineum]